MFWNHQKQDFVILASLPSLSKIIHIPVGSTLSSLSIGTNTMYIYTVHKKEKLILLFMEFINIWKSDESKRVFSV